MLARMADSAFISHEAPIRLLAFAGLLALLVFWERRGAIPGAAIRTARRWSSNCGMGLLDTLLLRLLFPAGAVTAAIVAAKHHWGLFNHLPIAGLAALVTSLVLLDLTIYLQHRLFHSLPWLWRIHRVHHADPAVDVSTALRFHPLESLLSMLLKTGVVVCLGVPPSGVLAFEILLNGAAMFNHANASLPPRWERWLRLALVTPCMHRIHHSTRIAEASGNFGFCLSGWDRLFASYRIPVATPLRGCVGLPDGPAVPGHIRLPWLLGMPFRKSP
jgi:sterol desaturase/sphingolipid hydroxylase (fatty acid hydroxylase superfamily)